MRRPEGKVRKEGLRLGRREIALGVALAVFVLLVSLVVRAAMRRPSVDENGVVQADWCATGLEPVGDACFAAAPESKALIVYLHGRYTPETEGEEKERQARVARMATASGFSVIAFRGKQGGCVGPELATYFCWPSNEKTQDAGPETVTSWSASLASVEKRIGNVPRYLLGFSNGAYFAALITTRALMPFDAVAIVSGGPVEPTKAFGAKPPILLVTADDDGAQDEMLRLESELARERWPKTLASREGPHALTDFDVDMALKFFQRAPIPTRRPIHSVDAAAITTPPEEDAGAAAAPPPDDTTNDDP
jgi:predicted esterase